jgi:hypothetical protein
MFNIFVFIFSSSLFFYKLSGMTFYQYWRDSHRCPKIKLEQGCDVNDEKRKEGRFGYSNDSGVVCSGN